MAIEAQRIHDRADQIRKAREDRKAEYDSRHGEGPGTTEDPDDDPTLREGPQIDDESVIARTEALSAMVTSGDQQGFPVERDVYDRAADGISELGREMSDMVDTRLEEWRGQLGAELDAVAPGNTSKTFIFGSLYGAAVCLGSLAGALILTRLGRKD